MSEFTKQYAIRLPNGLLHGHKPGQYAFSQFGLITYQPTDDENAEIEVVVYDDLEDAEYALKGFQEKAAHLGITEWLGRIETRYCTAFSDSSVGGEKDMMMDLEKYLEDQ